MSKDYKHSSRKSSSARRSGGGGGSSIFAGLLIGLCIGIAIAVAAALYLNKTPNPFAKPARPVAPPVAAQPPQPEILLPPGQTKPPAGQTVPGQPAGDRFDFYTMLPEQGGEPKSAPAAKAPETTPPATVAPPSGTYLQAGAFQNETDADNLKAKLALVGIEANIQTAEVAGKGVWHRVRIGPLTKAEDIDRIRAQLKVNGVEASLVKQ